MEILIAIAAKVGEYLVDPAKNQVRYLCCFNRVVEDLEDEERKLKSAEENVKIDVETSERSTGKIREDVTEWLRGASNVLAEVQNLKEEIDSSKTCLNGWCPNCCCRYWLARKAAKKTSIMLKLRDTSKFNRVALHTTLPGIGFFASKDFQLFRSSKFAFDQVIEALKNDQTRMVGLYGMGGAGKTTLAKEVGNRVKEEKIFDEVVMVVVSQTPNFRNIQGVLADMLNFKLEEESEEGRAQRLYLRFTETKTVTKKILVILDDVWEKFDLKSKVGFPLGEDNNGCKILLTTRRQHVCYAMECEPRITLDLLNDDEGLALLKRHAGLGNESDNLNALALEVANECKGLPLAIVTIGSALKEKGADEWKLVSQKLKKSKFTDTCGVDVDKNVYAILKFSYDYLKGEEIKFCFLLCSLFPEDHEILLEELVRCGVGLGLFPDAESVEDSRIALRTMVNNLKASFLLLDAGDEKHVKMHDIVRDVALWIASQGKHIFMVKAGLRLTEWPNEDGLEHYSAISLIGNDIKVLPNSPCCPKLEILLMEGASKYTKVPDQFFEEMKGLKVLKMRFWELSLRSLQFLTYLKTLELIGCLLTDFSYLARLKNLEILSFKHSYLDELPREVVELHKLRLLDLYGCKVLKRIPSNLIRRCSQLEELDITSSFTKWKVEETNTEGSNASLFELNSLTHLVRLRLRVDAQYISKDFAFPKLSSYTIAMNTSPDQSYKRALKISDIEAASMTAFKSLYETSEYLYLENIMGCQNIVPSIHEGGLKELKEMEILTCGMLQYVFQLEGLSNAGKENLVLLPSLVNLELKELPQLQSIWKGPTHHIDLKSLKYLRIDSCESLEYIFPISIAGALVHLEQLFIENAPKLKRVFHMDHGTEGNVAEGEGKEISLPKLRELTLKGLDNFTSFLPESYHLFCSALEELRICNCSSWTTFSMEDIKEKLRILKIEDCHYELCDGLMLSCLRGGFKSLEKLKITDCGVEVVFQLDGLDGREDELLLPNLKEVILESLTRLEGLIKGPTHILSLHNLTILEVRKCHELRYIFSSILVPNLLQLSELSIEDCGELEEIIVVEDNIQPISFPNLSRVTVKRCNKLKYLFPLPIAQSLQKLNVITLEDSLHFEAIIGRIDGVDFMGDKEIVLPQLMKLSLKALPSFTNICPAGYHFISKLRILEIEDCHHELCDGLMLDCLRYGFKGLENLIIKNCGVEVVFQLEGLDGQQDELLFPNLKEVRLESLTRLEGLVKGSIHNLSLQNLTILEVSKCHELRYIFSSVLVPNLLQLSELYIEDCGELGQIIAVEDHTHPLSFPNLSRVVVKTCNKLKYLFPLTIAQSLQKLEDITLEDSLHLEAIFGRIDGVDFMGDKEIVLPQLTNLSLGALPCFTNFCPAGYHFILKLDTLSMQGFHENHQVWAETFRYLRDVKELYIKDLGVKELNGLSKSPAHILNLQNLALLDVCRCNQLKHIFSPTLAQSLLQLEKLYVWDCGDLEEIIVEDDEEDHLQPLLFPNLSLISVKRCNKLKRVFPIIIARGLQQLKYMLVENNSQLEEVFGHRVRDGADVMDDKPIVFPQLRWLSFGILPSLTNFCPVGYHFIFPSLGEDAGALYVLGCGKVATRFSLDEKGSVHAEGKPPKDDQDPPTVDIKCYFYYEFRAKLPPYVEKLNEEHEEIK